MSSMTSGASAADLTRLAVLQDPLRRRLYMFVAGQGEPVGRDAAAAAVGISRRLAAFHLDKIAESGLLDVSYRRLTDRRGPGAGRPAKLYARASDEVSVCLPPRDYELVAAVLAAAAARLGDAGAAAVVDAARETGAALAGDHAPQASAATAGECLADLLSCLGYEPYVEHGLIRLRNCPFHRAAARHRELICTANLHLLRGAIEQLGAATTAELDPRRDECCVVLQHATHHDGGCTPPPQPCEAAEPSAVRAAPDGARRS